MNRFLIMLPILLLIGEVCLSQKPSKQSFGTKNIDHELIAIDFMTKLEDKDYKTCYGLLSEGFKEGINLEDFQFKMEMLNDLAADDEFYHYKTTFIGKTAKEGLAIINGEEVTENIMPEYDFTLKSEADKEYKTVQIFIRFENENSDKISVINYAKHKLVNEQTGMSSISSNPFIVGNYILIAENGEKIYVDIRGGKLRNELIGLLPNYKGEVLIEIRLNELENFLSQSNTSNFSLIHIREVGESLIAPKIKRLAEENGFSVFNYKDKEFKSISIESSKIFLNKYKEGNWNPIK